MEIQLKGANIAYDERGEGESIILLHGLGANRKVWEDSFERLSTKFHVINVDMRGFGDSGKTSIRELDFSIWKNDLISLINEITSNKVHIVGHSLGSFIALAIAVEIPEKINSITAISCFKEFGPKVSQLFSKRAKIVKEQGLTSEIIKTTIDMGFYKKSFSIMPAKINKYKEILIGNHKDNYANALLAINGLSIANELPKITCPVLVISGAEDQVIPWPESKEVHEKIMGAEWSLIEEAGHQVHLEQTEKVEDEIIRFLNKCK